MWSKLFNTSVEIIAREYYYLNHCAYHNWQHILDCYQYLEQEQILYDEDLDFAVMHHDIVYDNKPEKELRSANWLLDHYPSRSKSAEIIMSTVNHKTKGLDCQSVQMIKADLHQLADPIKALENYVKIMHESMKIYGINQKEFAKNNLDFMRSLQVTAFENYDDEGDTIFWDNILKGIDLTIGISQTLNRTLE